MKQILSCCIMILVTVASCATVKEYDKAILNDEEMTLAAKSLERFETNFQIYREGSSGANGGKTGGGCGCN